MDTDIYALVAKYGFKNLHIRLEELMREEYTYFQLKFQSSPVIHPEQVKQVHHVLPQRKKEKKVRVKKPVQTSELSSEANGGFVVQSEDIQQSLDEVELKDVIVKVSEKVFREPKEMKEFQKNAVEAKRKENEANGLTPSNFLTKENLKQWIEDEGQTYAWVAREKAGCPENQVSATAQMMGIKSRISKKMGRTMTGN
jgi:hypothetical protein